jgi:hypothetical protein
MAQQSKVYTWNKAADQHRSAQQHSSTFTMKQANQRVAEGEA